MVDFETFQEFIDEIIQTFPEEFFRELHGGVFARAHAKLHPDARSGDLYIMGEYCVTPHLGRFIVIYYGSFARVHASLDEQSLKAALRKVLLHEFRHHLESLAGEHDLEVEDAIQIARYKGRAQEQNGGGRTSEG